MSKQPIYKIQYPQGARPAILSERLRGYDDLLNVPNPELTVITCSYNTGRFLEDTIRSVANQSFRNFEHLVIDGASTDDTISILKKYPHIKWISEKDSGYPEAFLKGLKMARGKYVTQCAVSDGFADENWFQYCVEAFNADPEIALVWGFAQYLSEDGMAGKVANEEYYYTPAPSKENFLERYLMDGGGAPEGNMCIRKEVVEECYPRDPMHWNEMVDWNEFNLNFCQRGYLAKFLPIVANFGRTHQGQMGLRENMSGLLKLKHKNLQKALKDYRLQVLLGKVKVVFRTSQGKVLETLFNRKRFFWQFVWYKISREYFLAKIKFGFYVLKRIPSKLKDKLFS